MESAKLQLTCLSVFSDHRLRFRNEERARVCGCQIAKIQQKHWSENVSF